MSEPIADEEKKLIPFDGVGTVFLGEKALLSLGPRSGVDVTTGFLELDRLRAQHNGWSEENPPRLERVARVVKFDAS